MDDVKNWSLHKVDILLKEFLANSFIALVF